MNGNVVTRFAPSPTGYMHIGNLRTALYSYLIAKHSGGKFILRIEDTDRERFVEGAQELIVDTLHETGLVYDEGPDVGGEHGPYIQSQRKEIYMEYAKKLVDAGHAYYCFCDKERLDSLHEEDSTGGYDRYCRNLPADEVEAKLAAGTPFVIRQKMPLDGTTTYTDEVFGTISMDNSELQDQILIKADGYPTYNFCHIIDDHLMGVTHVVRGSEYLTSTPKYVLLYDAYGWERPVYVHLPLLMGRAEDGTVSKLSKRHGAVSFADLTAEGYLSEAIINYIAFLGWCPKDSDNEFFNLSELCESFTIDGVSKSPSVFDYEKLLWFNSEYIRRLEPADFAARVEKYLPELPANIDRAKLLSLVQGRLDLLSSIGEKISFFISLPEYELSLFENKKNKLDIATAKRILETALPIFTALGEWNNDSLFAALSEVGSTLGCKTGAVAWSLRIAVSGTAVTPGGATEIMEVLGRDESLARMAIAIAKFDA